MDIQIISGTFPTAPISVYYGTISLRYPPAAIGCALLLAHKASGFILLADKSIKPGDVIQLGDKYGWINFLGSRYCSVGTRDGIEHLIPNENLITGEVINWSYSHNLVRLKIPVGIGYTSDLEKARGLMLQTAAETKRVLKDPEPSCYLLSFGDKPRWQCSSMRTTGNSWKQDTSQPVPCCLRVQQWSACAAH